MIQSSSTRKSSPAFEDHSDGNVRDKDVDNDDVIRLSSLDTSSKSLRFQRRKQGSSHLLLRPALSEGSVISHFLISECSRGAEALSIQ